MSTENYFLNFKCQLSIYHSSLAPLKPHEMEVPALPLGLNFLFSHSNDIPVTPECPGLALCNADLSTKDLATS